MFFAIVLNLRVRLHARWSRSLHLPVRLYLLLHLHLHLPLHLYLLGALAAEVATATLDMPTVCALMPLDAFSAILVLPVRATSGLASGGGIGVRNEEGLLMLVVDDRDRPDLVSRGVNETKAAGNAGNSNDTAP